MSRHTIESQPALGNHCLGPLASEVLGGGLLKYTFLGLTPEGPWNLHFSVCHEERIVCLKIEALGNIEVFALGNLHLLQWNFVY